MHTDERGYVMLTDTTAASVSADVTEAQIEALLVAAAEECPDVLRWLANQANRQDPLSEPLAFVRADMHRVQKASAGGTGENDILLTFRHVGRKQPDTSLLLIENKVNAKFTLNQPQRYQERVTQLRRSRQYATVNSVLLAPASYIEMSRESQLFDARVTYESAAKYFGDMATAGYAKGEALRAAFAGGVLKRSLGWDVHKSRPAVCDFRQQYYEFVLVEAPSLQMDPPEKRFDHNTWIRFGKALPKSKGRPTCILMHKVFDRAAIEIRLPSNQHESAFATLRPQLEPDMQLNPAKASFTIWLPTPHLETRDPFDGQRAQVKRCVEQLLRLQKWFGTHEAVIIGL